MLERLTADIALLAAKDQQVRYISNATTSEYLLPEELLSSIDSGWVWAQHPANRDKLSLAQIFALANLLRYIDRFEPELLTEEAVANLAADNGAWAYLRFEATKALAAFS